MVEILDTTLREGEQTPYVNFLVKEKIEIAQRLDTVGVEMIEAGDPTVSPKVAAAIGEIANLGLQAEIVAHSLANKAGINQAKAVGADRVAIFYPTSQIHLETKTHRTPEEAVAIVVEHVRYARSLGLKVRYTPEDATRTSFEFLTDICNAAIEAGADRISYADTLGIIQPHEMYARINDLRASLLPCKIDLHCHNDYGLALANAMAGIRAGADCIHTCVNGLGERAGIPDLSEAVVAYHNLRGVTQYNLEPLVSLAAYLENITGFFTAPNKPITGQNAFSHKCGVHANGVLKNPLTYESFDPALLGRERKIIIDKYTGKRAVAARLSEYGIEATPEELIQIVTDIKNIGDERKLLFDTDIVEIAEQVTGIASDAIPRDIQAIVMIEAESHVYTSALVRRLRNFKNVSSVYEITGDYDISSLVRAADVHALNNLIEELRTIPGIKQTDTRLVLKKYATNEMVTEV
jgi:2-isopropylmalate synthase